MRTDFKILKMKIFTSPNPWGFTNIIRGQIHDFEEPMRNTEDLIAKCDLSAAVYIEHLPARNYGRANNKSHGMKECL